jgi:hypothetical protein
MMKQEARQIPVTTAVMKVSGVVVRTPIERIKKGQKMSDPTAEYLLSRGMLHQRNAVKSMAEGDKERSVTELMSMVHYLTLGTTKARSNASSLNSTSNASV